jgi:hypothetical protein
MMRMTVVVGGQQYYYDHHDFPYQQYYAINFHRHHRALVLWPRFDIHANRWLIDVDELLV